MSSASSRETRLTIHLPSSRYKLALGVLVQTGKRMDLDNRRLFFNFYIRSISRSSGNHLDRNRSHWQKR